MDTKKPLGPKGTSPDRKATSPDRKATSPLSKAVQRTRLINKMRTLFRKKFPEKIQTKFDNSFFLIGSSLLAGSQSDLDICLGRMSEHENALAVLERAARDVLAQHFSQVQVSYRKLNTYMGIPFPVMRLIVKVMTITPQERMPTGFVKQIHTDIIGVVDLIFHPFGRLPKWLFSKGALYKPENMPVASRSHQTVEQLKKDAKKKKTFVNLHRAEELAKSGQTVKIQWKILCLLLRGWDIVNCKLKAAVPKDVSDQVEAYWLTMTATGGMGSWFVTFLPQVKFYITRNGQKIPISGKKILYERVLQDNLTLRLPNGISVLAFTDQTDWTDTKKLDSICAICREKRENWKEKTVCWRSMECPHVMCCTCHEKTRGSKYEKYCPMCRHPISKMAC
jgi:hypothetical protein